MQAGSKAEETFMWFERFRQRRKRDQMARDLGVTLRQRFGPRGHYRPADVYASGALLGLSGAMLGYGLALYCTRDDFNHATRGTSGSGDYDQLRAEFGPLERYDQSGGASDTWATGSSEAGGGGVSEATDGSGIGGHGDASGNDGGSDGGSSDGSTGSSGDGTGGDGGGGDGGGE
jgi:hypothetical protein